MKYLIFTLLMLGSTVCRAQTTVILVRHAEKIQDNSKDPGLTKEGTTRAQELLRVLENTEIDEIYTTPFNRTRLTVEPLAKHFDLDVQEYNPFDLPAIVEKIRLAGKKTLVFSGHSNTTPILANLLLGNEKFKPLNEKDYDNLYIITLNEGNSSVVQIAYGVPSVF